jgi:hypothetical protein
MVGEAAEIGETKSAARFETAAKAKEELDLVGIEDALFEAVTLVDFTRPCRF